MSLRARMGIMAAVALAWLGLAATVTASPIVSTPQYNVTLPGGGHYLISGEVDSAGSGGYIYTYTVQNLNAKESGHRTFELGLASHPYLWGKYSETNVQGSPGPAIVLHDLIPHTTIMPWLGRHNYVFTNLQGKNRIGVPIDPGETQVLSFWDAHVPTLMRWSLREIKPSVVTRNNAILKVGKLPVPSAPEPSTLALAGIGIASLGLGAWRRLRRKGQTDEAGPGEGEKA